MPMMNQAPKQDSLLKLLLIADSKCGKTPWAAMAALHYNVLYLDGDVGIQSLNAYVPEEAKARIAYMNVGDYVDENGQYIHRFADFFKTFATEGTYTWNDSRGETFQRRDYVFGESKDTVWQVRPARMDHTSVLIIDSWTALSQSAMEWKAGDLSVDLGEIEKVQREIYSGVGNKLTQFLTMIRSMPCHVIVIAHPREYVKLEKPAGTKIGAMAEKDMKIEWTKLVPVSSSNPHSLTMPKYFTDVGWLDMQPNGKSKIDFRPATNRIIGGHLNSFSDAESTLPADLIRAIGGYVPDVEPASDFDRSQWLTIFPEGTFEPAGGKKPVVLTQSADNAVLNHKPSSGLASLLSKTKGVEPGMNK
jgi:AAA domain